MFFGNKIGKLRDEQGLLQRQLAVALEIDTPMFTETVEVYLYTKMPSLPSLSPFVPLFIGV